MQDTHRLGLPSELLKLVALTLPWLEILIAFALVIRFRLHTAAILLTALLGGFVFLTGLAMLRGLDIACGCFNWGLLGLDKSGELVGWLESATFAFFRNLALLALALWFMRKMPPSEATIPEGGPGPLAESGS